MSLGLQMMMDTILKSLKLNPEEVKKSVADIGQIAVNANNRLAAIEAQGARIERKLNLLLDAQGLDYAETDIAPAGTQFRLDAQSGNAGAPTD